jgi:hypothetical protein
VWGGSSTDQGRAESELGAGLQTSNSGGLSLVAGCAQHLDRRRQRASGDLGPARLDEGANAGRLA